MMRNKNRFSLEIGQEKSENLVLYIDKRLSSNHFGKKKQNGHTHKHTTHAPLLRPFLIMNGEIIYCLRPFKSTEDANRHRLHPMPSPSLPAH